MTRYFSPIPFVAFTAPLLATTNIQAQTLSPETRSADERTFVASHWEAIAIGASLIAAGIGTSLLLWKSRKQRPNDGITRTPPQLRAFRNMAAAEKILLGDQRAPRRAALADLLNIVPNLAPTDRSRAFRRIAQQLSMDWRWIMEGPEVDRAIRMKVLRWPQNYRDELTQQLTESLDSPQEGIQNNARAALKWFQQK